MRRKKILLVLFFLISPFLALAEAGPGTACDDSDPYATCPLDSWVYMLVLAPVTVTFVGIYLRNEAIKQHNKDKENQ